MLFHFKEDLDLVLAHTKDCWQDLSNKTIFITGGTGFFGIWMQLSFIHINRELGLNSKLILLTRSKSRFLSTYPWIENYDEISFLEGDILDFEYIDGKIDYIIHAATDASVKLNLEEPLTMFETVVNGTKHILEFARLKKVKSFLMTSSGAVYGKQPSDIENLAETYIGAPGASDSTSVYGEGKRMAEVLCAVYHKHYNLPVKIARCYAFIGPFLPLDSHFAAGNFIRNLINDEEIVIEGNGTPFRSYMYAADLVTWLWTILFRGKDNTPYNVGSDKSITIEELANIIADGNTQVIVSRPKDGKPPLRYVPNIDRCKEDLNLKIYTSLDESIKKTIEFNKKFYFRKYIKF